MAGPWEKYKQEAPADGPWAKYGKAAPKGSAAPLEDPNPTEGMGAADRFRAGLGKSMVDTISGARQFATEAVAAPLAAVGNIYGALGMGGAQEGLQAPSREAARLRSQETERKALDAPLMRTPAGLAGNVTGTALQLIGPGAALRGTKAAPYLLPRTVAGNARQGALLGLIQPVGDEDSRTQNVALGTAAGGVGAAVPALLGAGYRGARSILEPLTQRGQENIIGRLLQASATDASRLATAAPSAVPGVTRTLAEESADPGISQLQRQFSPQLAGQAGANNAARAQAIRRTFEGADDASVAAIESARDKAAGETLRGLRGIRNPPPVQTPKAEPDFFAGLGGVRPKPVAAEAAQEVITLKPVNSTINALIKKADRRPEVQSALQYVQGLTKKPVRNAEEAYNVRKTIGDLMDGRLGADKASATTARRELMLVRDVLDRQMREAFPEWGSYLQNYKAASRRADQARVGERLLERSRQAVDPITGERTMSANDLASSANNVEGLVRQATGFRRATPESALTDQQRTLLSYLGDDAGRMAAAQNSGRAVGSDTAQNLATRNILSTLAGGSRLANLATQAQPMQRLAALGEKTYGVLGVPDRLQSVLVEALSDPSRARQILGRLPGPDRRLVEGALSRVGGTLGAVSPALAE